MKKRFGSGRLIPRLLGLAVLIGTGSCLTLPEEPYPDILDWLPPESNLVLRFSVPGNQALADLLLKSLGMDPVGMADILGRTALLAVGMETDGAWNSFDALPVHLVAVGAWPRGLIGGALGEQWSRSRPYRWEGSRELTLAALSREEILLSRGRLDEMIERRNRKAAVAPSVAERDDFPGIDLVVRITDPRLIDTLAPVLVGSIDRMDLGLKRREGERYSAFLSLYPADERFTESLALAIRIALSARFGMSPNPQERNLLSEMSLDIGPGEIRVDLPPMTMDLLKGLFAALNPGSGESL